MKAQTKRQNIKIAAFVRHLLSQHEQSKCLCKVILEKFLNYAARAQTNTKAKWQPSSHKCPQNTNSINACGEIPSCASYRVHFACSLIRMRYKIWKTYLKNLEIKYKIEEPSQNTTAPAKRLGSMIPGVTMLPEVFAFVLHVSTMVKAYEIEFLISVIPYLKTPCPTGTLLQHKHDSTVRGSFRITKLKLQNNFRCTLGEWVCRTCSWQ